ncbi:MAG: hypothetical protein WC924_02770 [Candidatus Gracilibacteria bacterium]
MKVKSLPGQTLPQRLNLSRIQKQKVCRFPISLALKNSLEFFILLAHNNRAIRLDDAGLLMGNFCFGFSQNLRVLQVNIRDHAYRFLNHVRSVVTSTHPNFQNGQIDFLIGKIKEPHNGQRLE